jgi:iron(III) transport system substrate-binding protein
MKRAPRPVLIAVALAAASCGGASPPEVVVYTSVDEVYAREIFQAFTRDTGVRVLPVFDAEEAKTLGLVHRLVAERARPQADAFWNGECSRTALLKEKGILEAYRSPSAQAVPAEWRDPEDTWTGFGARARVIVYNTRRVKEPPATVAELADPKWKGRAAMANPAFGTTAAHVAALAQKLGEEPALRLLAALKANGLRLAGGNSHVRDLVASGECDVGLTDTDDVWIGKDRGDPIEMVYPDQKEAGTLVIPNSVALVRGAPRPAEARRFVDWLLRPETEALLARSRSRQMPVRKGVPGPAGAPELSTLRAMSVDWVRITTSDVFFDRVRKTLDL